MVVIETNESEMNRSDKLGEKWLSCPKKAEN